MLGFQKPLHSKMGMPVVTKFDSLLDKPYWPARTAVHSVQHSEHVRDHLGRFNLEIGYTTGDHKNGFRVNS